MRMHFSCQRDSYLPHVSQTLSLLVPTYRNNKRATWDMLTCGERGGRWQHVIERWNIIALICGFHLMTWDLMHELCIGWHEITQLILHLHYLAPSFPPLLFARCSAVRKSVRAPWIDQSFNLSTKDKLLWCSLLLDIFWESDLMCEKVPQISGRVSSMVDERVGRVRGSALKWKFVINLLFLHIENGIISTWASQSDCIEPLVHI